MSTGGELLSAWTQKSFNSHLSLNIWVHVVNPNCSISSKARNQIDSGKKLHTNLSRMAMVVWLFVALIVVQSYTASLASMLTAQRLDPTIKNVETLKNMDATVGYCKGTLVNEDFAEGYPSDEKCHGYINNNDRVLLKKDNF